MPDEESTPETASPAEHKTAVPAPATPYTDPYPGYDSSGVPTFESVREKIETRYGTALGATELDAESPEGRQVEEQYEERQRAAAERLAQIRESMHTDE